MNIMCLYNGLALTDSSLSRQSPPPPTIFKDHDVLWKLRPDSCVWVCRDACAVLYFCSLRLLYFSLEMCNIVVFKQPVPRDCGLLSGN